MNKITVLIIVSCLFIISCKKETFITGHDARLATSSDTLHFDTVFTSVGSVTQFFRIYNQNNQKLLLNNVKLSGGAASVFKINVDGFIGPEIKDIEIDANDSIYVFVSVKIDPSAGNLPFVVQDSIGIQYNGNMRWVQLEAWGQNANFLRSQLITGSHTWSNTKPYVILGGLLIDTNAVLNIQKGTRIYLHADAPLIVDGSLKVFGEKYDSTRVTFQGDRLDEPYKNFPAGWPGIYFRQSSKDNVLNFAIIKNAFQGLVADKPSVNANPKLTLNECIIDNCYDAGILGIQSNITAQNCLISNCGKNVLLVRGGIYNFTHCTSAAYSNSFILHKEPALLVTNFIKDGNNFLTADLTATFRNCIFWGDNGTTDDEVVVTKQGSTVFSVIFQNSLWKVKNNPANVTASAMVVNQNPLFDSINTQKRFYNFRLKPTSPAINKGFTTSIPFDLDGNPRSIALPDLGSYEKQ